MQTIYYISDRRGHRISIDVPFPDNEDEITKRPPPTRKPQNHAEARKKYASPVFEEAKSFEQNRIDESPRKAKTQEPRAFGGIRERKIETTKQTTTARPKFVAQKVKEPEKPVVVEEIASAEDEKEQEAAEEVEGEPENATEQEDVAE